MVIAGAFCAAFVVGAVGFADALILSAIWLHVLSPAQAVPLLLMCSVIMHIGPLYKLRRDLDFSRLLPFLIGGALFIPLGTAALAYIEPNAFKRSIGALLIVVASYSLIKRHASVGEFGGRALDGVVGAVGGFLGGFAGISGILPTLWSGLRGWPTNRQRGAYQPYLFIINGLTLIWFSVNGLITLDTVRDFLWCVPAIVAGSLLGIAAYRRLNETLFKRTVLALILISGISLSV